MRALVSLVAGAILSVALGLPASAAEMTVKGTIACFPYPNEPEKPAADDTSTMACAKKGLPVGIRTADATFRVTGDYTANNNAKLLDFVSRTILASGEVVEKSGQKFMNVKSIKLVLK
jgi:hypothetical protein